MKKANEAKKDEVKKDANEVETSHFKNGQRWLAWVTGLTTVWLLVNFFTGLCNDVYTTRCVSCLNVWYVVNIAILTVMACYSTVCILKKCASQIFWSASTMFLIVLQSVSLIIIYFLKQDSGAINALALFVWGICWFGYMLTSSNVEGDLPSAYRNHPKFGEIVLAVMALSTVGYGLTVVFGHVF